MQLIKKKDLLALDQWAILERAKAAGLAIHFEDLFVKYAEIDHELTDREEIMISKAKDQIQDWARNWLSRIQSKEDLDPESMDLDEILAPIYLEHIKSVWKYGQDAADDELERMNKATNGEIQMFAAGSPVTSDLTNEDAFEWYDQYSRQLAQGTQDQLFHLMQPTILEHLDKGTVRLGLAKELAADFARYGSVRADIIAKTESSKAFNWGRRYRFDQSPSLGGYRYSAIMDGRTTPICMGLHGHSWEKKDPDLDSVTPPNHYRCRSILVPISKYQDWTFDPGDIRSQLDGKDLEMFNRFTDSAFYPKATTVRPKDQKKPGAKAAPKTAPQQPDPDPPGMDPKELETRMQEFEEFSHKAAIDYYQGLIDYNVNKNGIPATHPGLKVFSDRISEIKSGAFNGKVVTAEWNARSKTNVLERVYKRHGGVYITEVGKISPMDRALMMEQIEKIKDDPLYRGVKIMMESGNKSYNGMYNSVNDILTLTSQAVRSNKNRTLLHEVGHRVHNQPLLYKSQYEDILRKNEINITTDKWTEWEKTVAQFWDRNRTPFGSQYLPNDLPRFEYPMNAAYYYKNGTIDNFRKEMFAESSSAYLSNDLEEMARVIRTYPGVMEYMEDVYKRGHLTEAKKTYERMFVK